MASAEKILREIDRLEGNGDTKEIIFNIKHLVLEAQHDTLTQCVPNLGFPYLFSRLNNDDKDVIEYTCSILSKLLAVLDATILIKQFHQDLIAGLSHAVVNVRLLCLQQICRACEADPDFVLSYADIPLQLIAAISQKSLEQANIAICAITLLGKSSSGVSAIFTESVLNALYSVTSDATVRFRVFELVIKLSNISEEALSCCTSHGFMSMIEEDVFHDDILVQLNAIEVLSEATEAEHCARYLKSKGTIHKLINLFTGQPLQQSPFGNLLAPGLMKFFGGYCYLYPSEINGELRPFMAKLYSFISGDDDSVKLLAIETLGLLACNAQGKINLHEQGNTFYGAVKTLANTMKSTKNAEKVKSLEAITNLIALKPSDRREELYNLTNTIYTQLGSHTQTTLYELATQPFPEVKCAALAVYRALASLPWGQVCLKNHPGFCEYLLDRSTEKQKETKDAKYEVVRALVHSDGTSHVFGEEYMVELKRYFIEGPHYVKVETQVAMEEQT